MPAFCLTAVQALVSTTTRNCGPAQRRGAWLPHGFVVIMVVVKQRPSMVLQVYTSLIQVVKNIMLFTKILSMYIYIYNMKDARRNKLHAG